MLTAFSIDTILGNPEKSTDKVLIKIEEQKDEYIMQQEEKKTGECKPDSPNNSQNNPSYTSIIAQAILSSPNNKLSLGCIYDYIAKQFPDFLKKGQGWRNCVRHNLSLSECFIKAGRAKNGRGNYWGIHPRYEKNFTKGDYRKRRASHRSRQREFDFMLGASRYCLPYMQKQEFLKTMVKQKPSFSIDSILSESKTPIATCSDITSDKMLVDYRTRVNTFRSQFMDAYNYSPYNSPSPPQHMTCLPTPSPHGFYNGNICSC